MVGFLQFHKGKLLIFPDFSSEGFKEAAEKFQEESGIEPDVDLSTLDNRILIREAVQQGKIQESIKLVNDLHPELLDNDRYLYFHLQQLHLIELIRFDDRCLSKLSLI
jgi:glucose-induced degradation protein 8